MDSRYSVLLSLSLGVCLMGVQARSKDSKILSNEDIVRMQQSGLSEEIILAKIESSQGSFDTSPEVLESLKQAGLPDSALVSMIKKASAVRRRSTPDCQPISAGEAIRVRLDSANPELAFELLGEMTKEGMKKGLHFEQVDEGEWYHFRIAVVGETSASTLGTSQTGAVVLTGDCEVLTAVIRSGRWTKSGAARAVGKQLAKDLATLEKTGGLNAICQN